MALSKNVTPELHELFRLGNAKPTLSGAERAKRFRDKKKQQGLHEEQCAKNAARMSQSRKRKAADLGHLSERSQKHAKLAEREYERERKRLYRAKKKQQSVAPSQTPEPQTPSKTAFSTEAALRRAKSRAKLGLPSSPRKKKAVARELYQDYVTVPTELNPRDTVSDKDLIGNASDQLVIQFYTRDDISRQAPGRKDARRTPGTKERKQIRHLYCSLEETHALFKTEHPDVKLGLTKFKALRPSHVLYSSKMPHNVCLCKYHENFILAIDALHKKVPDIPKYSEQTPNSLLCDSPTEHCWNNECPHCCDGKRFHAIFDESVVDEVEVNWFVWETGAEKQLMKVCKEGTTEDLRSHIVSMIPSFLLHTHTKREQAASYNALRAAAESTSLTYEPESSMLQVDFSENFTCMEQDEIQSGHWAHPSVTLFTYSLWYHGSQHAGVITSDSNVHSKETIIPYMDKILSAIPEDIKQLQIFSDGPSSQFKNRFIVAAVPALEAKYGLAIIWNYFATSHGKGPVDGIGGSTKRFVWNLVRSGKAQVMSSTGFTKAASSMPKVTVTHMPAEEMTERAGTIGLQNIFEAAPAVACIRKMHSFSHINGQLRTADLSRDLDVHPVPQDVVRITYQVGQFVTAVYQEEIYIAQVESVSEAELELSFMRPHGLSKCNWPRKPDILLVPQCDVMSVVQPPAPLSSMSRFVGLSRQDKEQSLKNFELWKISTII